MHRIVTPYNADAFERLLKQYDLISQYPLLPYNLRFGFPMGEMPKLEASVIFPNHPTCNDYMNDVNAYLDVEVKAGRMSGPFPQTVVEQILGGPIYVSPLIVAVSPQEPGKPDKVRICRHLSKGNKHSEAVNAHIVKECFPTRFDTPSRVADIVSILFIFILSSPFCSP